MISENRTTSLFEKRRGWDLRKTLILVVRIILGGVFIYASFDKILNPAAFAEVVYNFQILPGQLINLTAIILPWLELLLGVFLILGVWFHGTVFLCNLLLVSFFGAILFNVTRGLDVDCGCFSTTSGGSSGVSMVWPLLRDGVFLLLGGYLFYSVFLKKRQTGYMHPN